MAELICMVGIAGSGKSTWAKQLNAIYSNSIVISSDAMRERVSGDEAIQGDNNALFEAIYAEIISYLTSGRDVIFDATNILVKNRIHLLDKVGKYATKKSAFVVATQYDICIAQNKMRTRQVPEHVIERMRKSFTFPQYYSEGWDEIQLEARFNPDDYYFQEYLDKIADYAQDNIHHTMTLGKHVEAVRDYLYDKDADIELLYAGLLHDCGKPATKVFKNMKGEDTEIAHYYGHAEVGAYEAIFYLLNQRFPTDAIAWVCGLIQYHMRMYDLKSGKSIEKFKKLVGEKMYVDLCLLHEADEQAH
jgi:predicted kinase